MDFRASLFSRVCYKRFGFSKDCGGGWCGCGTQCCEDVHAGTGCGLVVGDGFDVDQKWQSFLANEGWMISQEIYANFESTLNLFDTDDGTHAKVTADGRVGVLLMFEEDDIDMLLGTYFEGMDGSEGAQRAFGTWVSGVMGLLESCVTDFPPEG